MAEVAGGNGEALYQRYAFHHAVQELTAYRSEELGAFYLDILKGSPLHHRRRFGRTPLGPNRAASHHPQPGTNCWLRSCRLPPKRHSAGSAATRKTAYSCHTWHDLPAVADGGLAGSLEHAA